MYSGIVPPKKEESKCKFILKADSSAAAQADEKTTSQRHMLPQGGHHVAEVAIIGLILEVLLIAGL